MMCKHCQNTLSRLSLRQIYYQACGACLKKCDDFVARLGWRPDYEHVFEKDGLRCIPGK